MSLLAFKLVEASGIPKIYSKCYIWLFKIIGLNTVVVNEWLLPANRTKGIPKKLYIGSSIFHWFTIPTPNFHYYDEMYVVCVFVCGGGVLRMRVIVGGGCSRIFVEATGQLCEDGCIRPHLCEFLEANSSCQYWKTTFIHITVFQDLQLQPSSQSVSHVELNIAVNFSRELQYTLF